MARPKRTREPDRMDVSQWAESLPDRFLLCRDMGHEWDPYRAWYDGEISGYRRVMRCRRCKADRTQVLSISGHIMSSSYEYEDGYAAPKGSGMLYGPDRDALRLTSIVRLVEATPITTGRKGRQAS